VCTLVLIHMLAFLMHGLLGLALLGSGLEDAIDQAFGGRSGAAVVVRANDGRILAVHNLRTLRTRVATPSSVIKPFTLELLLDRGSFVRQRGLLVAGNWLWMARI
jgi:hypothetical protein